MSRIAASTTGGSPVVDFEGLIGDEIRADRFRRGLALANQLAEYDRQLRTLRRARAAIARDLKTWHRGGMRDAK